VVVTNCTIAGNQAVSGGGLYNYSGLLNIVNSTIVQNTATYGGGVYNYSIFADFVNSTVAGNTASAAGGGIFNLAGSEARSRNTIIATNTAATSGPDFAGALTSRGFNLVGNISGAAISPAQDSDQVGSAAAPIEPLLGSLQYNGGTTPTMALLVDSPAIEQGHSSGSTTDQRGVVRPLDNPAIANVAGGDGADIGAFEYVAAAMDIDGNGGYAALTDGLLIVRYLLELTGTSLTSDAIGVGATRSAGDIEQRLDGIKPALDVDGNGTTDALTDGVMLTRYLSGLRGSSLTGGLIGPGASRTTPAQIEAYIQSLAPQ